MEEREFEERWLEMGREMDMGGSAGTSLSVCFVHFACVLIGLCMAPLRAKKCDLNRPLL